MAIIIEPFTCGYLQKVHNNFYSKNVPIARIHGPDYGIFPSAGHVSAGDTSLITARELQEELGVTLPNDAFELVFVFLQECVTNDGKFIDNEFDDVYLVTTLLQAFTLQESEVSDVKYIPIEEYQQLLAKGDPHYAPYNVSGPYGQLFDIITKRYQKSTEAQVYFCKRSSTVMLLSLTGEMTGLTEEDKEVLVLLIQAARIMDDIFYQYVCLINLDKLMGV